MEKRLPPQDIASEQALLGALLIDSEAINRVIEILKPNSFYKPSHKAIYTAMTELYKQDYPIDITTVSEKLNTLGKLDLTGGRAYINDLALAVISSANIEYYSKIIADKALLRNISKIGKELFELGYEESKADDAVNIAEKLIDNLVGNTITSKLVGIDEFLFDIYNQAEKNYSNKNSVTGVESGFYDLDNLTAGFQPSDLIIIAARPSMGKTAFALNIAQEIGINKRKPVAIFSLEMSKEQLIQRMMCTQQEINSQNVRTGQLLDAEWGKLAKAMSDMSDCPIFIDDSPTNTIIDIKAKAKQLKMKKPDLSLIIIDYLQLMEGSGGKKFDRVQEVSQISRGLKNLARELNVPIIALSQLSRALESRPSKKPMLSDLRDSGSIEQDADVVMFIYRDEYYHPNEAKSRGKAEIIIAKQRNGPVGTVELLFQNSITKFKNTVRARGF